ncbi:MAG TPA: TetR/AcrR family transcriptional regulator [Candidatus Acidoferrales bacterium]|nr:TetR/AcrR family transcriptional regulator [Candidatus Acidoferrales bacterium]
MSAGAEQRAAARRIVAAARHHFFTHGFRGVTMDDLAAALGMSKKTLYACFPGKTALLEAVIRDKFRTVEADLERITAAAPADALGALRALLACVQAHTEEIQPPFVRDIQREAPEMFKVVESRRRELIRRYFGKLLGEGRRAGVIRKDIPTRLIMEILLGAVQAIMNPPKMAELGLTPKSGFSAIVAVVLEGALAPAARSKPQAAPLAERK